VFPARYELNSYIVFRKRLVSKRLISFSNIREGSLVVWCTVSCRVYRLNVLCAHTPNSDRQKYKVPISLR
jgi:hypothetical protein